MESSIETLGIDHKTIIDWFNFCRGVCYNTNRISHKILLGNGRGRGPNGETPETPIQIDGCLLRGKQMYNRGQLLLEDNGINPQDREELLNQQNGKAIDQRRNYGQRIRGPWKFGLTECQKN